MAIVRGEGVQAYQGRSQDKEEGEVMTKRKAAPKYVWVSRAPYEWAFYQLWDAEPRLFGDYWGLLDDGDAIEAICPESFERLMGVTLNIGECRRFEWRSPLVAIKKKGKVK